MIEFEQLKKALQAHNNSLEAMMFSAKELLFEERVKLKCFYCEKYNKTWTCPPRLPDLDFKKIVSEYQNAMFVISNNIADKDNYEDVRRKSSVEIHKAMLHLERFLWDNNNSLSVSFVGGSCKLCKNGCSKDECRNPGLARIPIEALGVNVISSLNKIGYNIVFPTDKQFIRAGLILW